MLQDFKSLYQEVIVQLEAKIDPFDLNVFMPYINSNVKITAFQTQVSFLILFTYIRIFILMLNSLIRNFVADFILKSRYFIQH